jgi:hypothetical protein
MRKVGVSADILTGYLSVQVRSITAWVNLLYTHSRVEDMFILDETIKRIYKYEEWYFLGYDAM